MTCLIVVIAVGILVAAGEAYATQGLLHSTPAAGNATVYSHSGS